MNNETWHGEKQGFRLLFLDNLLRVAYPIPHQTKLFDPTPFWQTFIHFFLVGEQLLDVDVFSSDIDTF